MRAGEAFKWSNLAAGTYNASNATTGQNNPNASGNLILQGGYYVVDIICTGTPSLALKKLGPNGSTFETVALQPSSATPNTWLLALVASGSIGYAWLPPGQYEITVATSTANYVSLTRIPTSE